MIQSVTMMPALAALLLRGFSAALLERVQLSVNDGLPGDCLSPQEFPDVVCPRGGLGDSIRPPGSAGFVVGIIIVLPGLDNGGGRACGVPAVCPACSVPAAVLRLPAVSLRRPSQNQSCEIVRSHFHTGFNVRL